MQISSFQRNILLSEYTTFRIGGPADYFYIAKSEDDLSGALNLAGQKKLPVFILGGGSNVLVSDKGFKGLVIKIQMTKLKFQIKSKGQMSKIMAGAGLALASLVQQSIDAGLTGLEWAAGIPGTLGGAIRGNAGAFGSDMAAIVDKVRVLRDGKVTEFSAGDCQFGYRDSVFKQKFHPSAELASGSFYSGNKIFIPVVILSAVLKLKKGDSGKSRQLVKDYLSQRCQKQPSQSSAGSVFKNVSICHPERTKRSKGSQEQTDLCGGLSGFFGQCLSLSGAKESQNDIPIRDGKVPAAYLIEQCGLKGKQIGQARISPKHANFIVNLDGAKTSDVISLITLAKQKVKEKFNLDLEEEIGYVGF